MSRRTRTEFRTRVQAVYRARFETNSRGALTWFAGVCEVDRRVVSRWVNGTQGAKPPGWAWALLRLLEDSYLKEGA